MYRVLSMDHTTNTPTHRGGRQNERERVRRERERERGRERLKKEQKLTREQKIHTILIKPNKSVFDANAAGGKKRSSRQWQWFQNCRVSSFPFLHCCHELSFLFSCKIHNQAQTHACAHTHTHTETHTHTHKHAHKHTHTHTQDWLCCFNHKYLLKPPSNESKLMY